MKIKITTLAACAVLLSSCHTIKQSSEQYERLPLKVEKNPEKEGRACHEIFIPFSIFYTNSDITVEAARQNGDIKEIVSIETESTQRPFYLKTCTVVKGN